LIEFFLSAQTISIAAEGGRMIEHRTSNTEFRTQKTASIKIKTIKNPLRQRRKNTSPLNTAELARLMRIFDSACGG